MSSAAGDISPKILFKRELNERLSRKKSWTWLVSNLIIIDREFIGAGHLTTTIGDLPSLVTSETQNESGQ